MELLARTQSEQRRRLALAGGFRLLRSSGIDRLDELAHAAGRVGQAQMGEDFDNHRRIFDGGPSTRLRTGDDLQAADGARFGGSGASFPIRIFLLPSLVRRKWRARRAYGARPPA